MSAITALSPLPPSAVKWVWKGIDCVRGAFDLITYVFFRVLSLFKPSFSEKAQHVWTHAALIWERLKSNWHERQFKEEKEKLLAQNQSLAQQVRQFLTEKSQAEKTRDEKINHNLDLLHQTDKLSAANTNLKRDLAREQEEARFAKLHLQNAKAQLESSAAQLKAEQERSALFEKSANALTLKCDILRTQIQTLQETLSAAQAQLRNSQDFSPLFTQWSQLLETISTHLTQLIQHCNAKNQPQINHEVQQLLPLFKKHIDTYLDPLNKEIQSLPSDNPMRIRHETFKTMILRLQTFFEQAILTIGLHSSVAQDLAQLSSLANNLATLFPKEPRYA